GVGDEDAVLWGRAGVLAGGTGQGATVGEQPLAARQGRLHQGGGGQVGVDLLGVPQAVRGEVESGGGGRGHGVPLLRALDRGFGIIPRRPGWGEARDGSGPPLPNPPATRYPAWRAPPAPSPTRHSTMRWLQTEYLLKGIYLGLVLYAALQQASIPPDSAGLAWECLLTVNLLTLAGLGAALVLAGLAKLREGFRVRGRLVPFLLFLLLESPTLAYLGILGGTVTGIYLVRERL